jgi:hypothetical protein
MAIIPPDYGTSSSYYSQNFDNIEELLQRLYDNNSNIIVAKDVRDPLWTLWNKVIGLSASLGSASISYTLGTPSTISVGGISEGTTFSNATLSDLFDLMLLPYVAPVVNNFGPSVLEKQFGDTTTLNLTYSINVGSSPLDSGYGIQFISPNPSSSIPNKVVTGNDPETGTTNNFSLTFSNSVSVTQTLLATMSFRTSDLIVFTTSTSLVAKHKRYYGQKSIPIGFTPSSPSSVSAVAAFLSDSVIKGLSYSELATNVNISQALNFNDEYFVFASPTVFGFNYPEGFFIDNIFSQDFTKVKSGVTFSNEFGYQAPYDVWVSNNKFYSPSLVTSIPLSIGDTQSIYTTIVGDKGEIGATGPTGPTGPSIVSGVASGNDIIFTDTTGYTFSVSDVGIIRTAKLFIPSASVLTLNSVPLTIVPAPGVGKAIEASTCAMKMTFNSLAYATNTQLRLITDTAPDPQVVFGANVLSSSTSIFRTISSTTTTNQGENIVENKDLTVLVDTGDPTAGDSDITVYVSYRIIEI